MKKSDLPFIKRGLIDANWQDIPKDQRAFLKREDCNKAQLRDFELSQKSRKLKFKTFVAVASNDQPVGFISVGKAQMSTVKLPFGAIFDFYVRKSFRNKGIGQRLFDFAADYLRKKGYSHLGLYVSKKNTAALHIYEKYGFYIDRMLMMKKL